MAFFPSSIFTFRTIANLPGIVYDAAKVTHFYVEDFLALIEEIAAIENTLGENPQGAFDTVGERIAAVEAAGTLTADRFLYNVKPVEAADGSQLTFTVPDEIVEGTLCVHFDGSRMDPNTPDADYSFDPDTLVVTAAEAPGNTVLFDYIKI